MNFIEQYAVQYYYYIIYSSWSFLMKMNEWMNEFKIFSLTNAKDEKRKNKDNSNDIVRRL